VRIGNSSIFKEPVFNYSSDFPFLWDEITVPIRFGSDYEAARASFLQELKDLTGEHASRLEGDWRKMTDKYMIENAQLQPMVALKITDDWVEFVLRYVVDYKKRRSTKDRISSRILDVIESSNGKIVLGAPAFEVASIPTLEIEVQKGE
jgi:small-conductance mechanosensitive channel